MIDQLFARIRRAVPEPAIAGVPYGEVLPPRALAFAARGPVTGATPPRDVNPHAVGDGSAKLQPGWTPVEHEHLPEPTYWPAVMAFGITLLVWGIVTTWIITVVGVVIFALALVNWIGELLHDH